MRVGLGQRVEGLNCLDEGQRNQSCVQIYTYIYWKTEYNSGIISFGCKVFQQELLEGFQFESEKINVLTWWLRTAKWE